MKIALMLCMVAAAVVAQQPLPVDQEYLIRISPPASKSEARDDHNQVALQYTTRDGQVVTLRGVLKPTADGDYVQVFEGSFSYNAPNGQRIITNYVADEYGYRPTGSHISVPATAAAPPPPGPPAPPPPPSDLDRSRFFRQ